MSEQMRRLGFEGQIYIMDEAVAGTEGQRKHPRSFGVVPLGVCSGVRKRSVRGVQILGGSHGAIPSRPSTSNSTAKSP